MLKKGVAHRCAPSLCDVMGSRIATTLLDAFITHGTAGRASKPCPHVPSKPQVGDVTSDKDKSNPTDTFFIVSYRKRGGNVATSRDPF